MPKIKLSALASVPSPSITTTGGSEYPLPDSIIVIAVTTPGVSPATHRPKSISTSASAPMPPPPLNITVVLFGLYPVPPSRITTSVTSADNTASAKANTNGSPPVNVTTGGLV